MIITTGDKKTKKTVEIPIKIEPEKYKATEGNIIMPMKTELPTGFNINYVKLKNIINNIPEKYIHWGLTEKPAVSPHHIFGVEPKVKKVPSARIIAERAVVQPIELETPPISRVPPKPPKSVPTQPLPEPPKDPRLEYKMKLLEEIDKLPEILPISPDIMKYRPQTWEFTNPITKNMYKLYDKLLDVWNSKMPKSVKIAQTKEIEGLLKERQRIIDSIVFRVKNNIAPLLKDLTKEQQEQLGLMINKYIPVTPEFEPIVKKIDTHIGQLSLSLVNIYDKWRDEGRVPKDMHLLLKDTVLEHLGEYARTFYVKPSPIPGRPPIQIPRFTRTKGVIGTSMFKHKLSLYEWGKYALEFDGKILDSDLERIKGLDGIYAERLRSAGYDTIPKIANMTEKELIDVLSLKGKKVMHLSQEIDATLRNQINDLLNRIGVPVEIRLKMRKGILGAFRKGIAELGIDPKIELKFATTEKTLTHELGHALDDKYNLQDLLVKDKLINPELRVIADSRLPEETTQYFRQYVRRGSEKVAEFVSVYITDNEKARLVAPNAVKKFEDFLKQHKELEILLTARPTQLKGELEIIKSDFAKEVIRDAKRLSENYDIVDSKTMTIQEVEKLGLELKIQTGWVYEAEAMLHRTFRDLAYQLANSMWLDAISESSELFSKTPKEGFIAVKDLLPRGVERDIRLGPLNDGYIHPGLVDEIRLFFTPERHFIPLFSEILSWYKASKVPLSIATTVRNFFSGITVQNDLAGAPVWSLIPHKGKINLQIQKQAIIDYITKGPLYHKWGDRGLYGAGYFDVELKPIDIKKIQNSIFPLKTFSDIVLEKSGKLRKLLTSYYGAIDHIQRTYLAEWAENLGATPQQAIYWANKWQLDYRFVVPIIEKLRSGVTGFFFPFISFYSLMIPNTLETLLTKPWKLLKYTILFIILEEIARRGLGLTKEEVEEKKPLFLRNKPYVIPVAKDEQTGKVTYLDLSYHLPISGINYLYLDFPELFTSIRGGGLAGSMYNALNNYDPFTNKKIYQDGDLPSIKREKMARYILRQTTTPLVFHFQNLYDAYQGKLYGYPPRKRDANELLLRMVGITVYSDPDIEIHREQLKRKKIKDMHSAFRSYLKQPSISQEEKQEKTKELHEEVQDTLKKYSR